MLPRTRSRYSHQASFGRFQSGSPSPSIRPSLHHRPFRFAICGGGPAGFYAASRLLALDNSSRIQVNLFESLPSPFGLSRYGVAPDHPQVKNCEHKFDQLAKDTRFRFYGNTRLTADTTSLPNHSAAVTLSSLRQTYDVVLLAYGAGLDRDLGGLPGENNLERILPARAAVNWYNGYPSNDNCFVHLSQVEHVTIIGQGNVALDIARILLTHIDVLAKTDISERALEGLARSRVKHVEIVGRRGPLQVSFTTKELRELLALPEVGFDIDRLVLSDAIERMREPGAIQRLTNGRMHKRLIDLMQKATDQRPLKSYSRSCSIKFLHTPLAFHATTHLSNPKPTVGSVEWELNRLEYPVSDEPVDYAAIRAIPIEPRATITTPTDLVLKSLGYRSIPIDPIPFDSSRSCVRNESGRVTGSDDQVVPGLYVTGWLSRGPSGVIANTMYDAFQTVDSIATDLAHQPDPPARPGQVNLINPQYSLDWSQWQAIDEEERRRGARKLKPREKILTVEEMLQVAGIL